MTVSRRMLHLNLFIDGNGHHDSAWRLPESDASASVDVDYYVGLARIAEAARFDSLFLADHPAIRRDPEFRPAPGLEPTTLLGALAFATERLGLIATGSTSYSEPYDLARRLASLDHISGGRVGWNIVTTAGDAAARNFGHDAQADHAVRYERAAEFVEVATKLWDSWDDDARLADKGSGVFVDADKMHPIGHTGEFFRVAGALTVPRSPQAYPVLVQAGSSSDGRAFAARYAEVVFTAQTRLSDAQAFSTDLKRRAVENGRRESDVLILPGLAPIVGSTEAEAKRLQEELNELISPAYGLTELSRIFETDLSDAALDAPLPEVPGEEEIKGDRSRAALVLRMARADDLSVLQLIKRLGGGRGHLTLVGTPEQVADGIQTWFDERAADGFNVMPMALPRDLVTFAEQVVPILRERGLFRSDYEGTTLRDHFGLSRPRSRFAQRSLIERGTA